MHGARATTWLIPSAASLLFSGRMAAPLIRADGFVAPCIPSLAHKPPSGPDWLHEIKHDGYRLIIRRDGKPVRLFTCPVFAQTPPNTTQLQPAPDIPGVIKAARCWRW
jgi:hypothetical protein